MDRQTGTANDTETGNAMYRQTGTATDTGNAMYRQTGTATDTDTGNAMYRQIGTATDIGNVQAKREAPGLEFKSGRDEVVRSSTTAALAAKFWPGGAMTWKKKLPS